MKPLAPQLAEPIAELPAGPGFVMEPKYDGIRILAQVTVDGEVKLWTRNQANKAEFCPDLCAELSVLPPNTWLDGEITASHWGKAHSALTNKHAAERPWYVVFDLLMLDGHDSRPLPLASRREILEGLFETLPKDRVLLTPQLAVDARMQEFLCRATSEGVANYDGVVIKALNAPYASGQRGRGWSKIKIKQTLDAVITGSKPGKGSISGLIGALRFSQYRGDKLVERGAVGGGFTLPQRRWFTEHLGELIEARAVVEIEHSGILHTGAPRNPRFLHLRSDKDASECMWDD